MSLISLLAGPLIGVIGSGLSAFAQYKAKQLDLQRLEQDHAQELRLQELSLRSRRAELESEAAIAASNAQALMAQASYRHDASYGVPTPRAAIILRMTRPVLTVGLVGLVAAFYFASEDAAQRGQITSTALFLAEVAVSWWFADRARQSKAEKG